MFDSGITAKQFVEDIKNEVDVALPISNFTYLTWINSLQFMLYGELIKIQRECTYDSNGELVQIINLSKLPIASGEAAVRFEDVYAVYTDYGAQLIKTSPTSGAIFDDSYYRTASGSMACNLSEPAGKIRIIYNIKPALLTVDEDDNICDGNIMVPLEFIDLVKSRIRGEAYKVMNEDALASKWISDYNVLVETFKLWLAQRQSQFGM